MDIVFVGAGRLATNFASALKQNGHRILAVWSRTIASDQAMGAKVGCQATDKLDALPLQADAFVVAIKDAALAEVIPSLCKGRENQVFLHTAGSMPLTVFSGYTQHGGVLYPMQTFSKERLVDFSCVPIFIEGADDVALDLARRLAESVSREVRVLSSADRKHLHLAAVFACNFANHCYALSAKILEQHGLPFEVMLPLIDETALKVHSMHPFAAQTGPAIRYDQNVIEAQKALLSDDADTQEIYDIMSKSIHRLAND